MLEEIMSRILFVALLTLLVAGIASAETPKEPELSPVEPAVREIDKAEMQDEALSLDNTRNLELRTAMNEEIALRLATEKTTIAGMATDLERAVTSDDKQATQRRISVAKQVAWRDILAIQLKYAHLGGHTEQAAELEERVARLDEGLSEPQSIRPSTSRDSAAQGKGSE
jgi:hypothetical protein